MPAYDQIIPAAYQPRDEGWEKTYQAISFPADWIRPLLTLQRYDRRDPNKIQSVPTWRLGQLLRALLPQVVSVGRDITVDGAGPWLYLHAGDKGSTSTIPPDLITAALTAWVHTINPKPGTEVLRREVLDSIRHTPLTWQPTTVDLHRHHVTSAGTALPAPATYHVLPDSLAAEIVHLPPFSIGAEQLRFLRTPTATGAELISWPPRRTDGSDEPGFFSLTVAITVQTVPFSNSFRVHLHTGIRRWVTKPNAIRWGRSATTYLLTDAPWMRGVPLSPGFAACGIRYRPELGDYGWVIGGPEGMLQRLTLSRQFPSPSDLLAQPRKWLDGVDGITAAVTHHTMMGSHAVGAGLMPFDRAKLMDWVLPAFTAHLQPVPPLTKSPYSGPLRTPPSPPASADDVAKAEWRNARRIADGHQQRAHLASHLRTQTDPQGADDTDARPRLDIDLMVHPGEQMQRGIRAAIMTDLALGEPDTSITGQWVWHTDDLEIRVHVASLGALGDKLTIKGRVNRRDQARRQINERREAIRAFFARGRTPSTMAIVELDDAGSYDTFGDPKHAIRLGFAAAGRVTQFVTPSKPRESVKAFEERMLATWRDGCRQLGVRVVPDHSLGDAVPPNLQYVGVWMIKRRADGPSHKPQHIPVAVLVSPNQRTVMGTAPGLAGWVDYRRLLLHLAAEGAKPVPDYPPDHRATMAAFIKRLITNVRGIPTLMITHAQTDRSAWPWLQNGNVLTDNIALGDNPPVAVRHLGRDLRIVRVRDSSSRETPQWYAPGRGSPGLATGLWRDTTLGGEHGRIFFSTTPKPGTMQKVAVSASKIVTRVTKRNVEKTDADVQAHNPQLLEIAVLAKQDADVPEVWAALVHQQRQTSDYRSALANPLCLHLAKLAGRYLLPHDGDQESSDEVSAEVATSEDADADGSDE